MQQVVMDQFQSSTHCPGLYCGRTVYENGSYSDCGACPRGFRSASTSLCVPCLDPPIFYDWLFLGYTVIVLLAVEWYIIDHTMRRRMPEMIYVLASTIVENGVAAVGALLVINPVGSLSLYSCGVQKLSDWYTLLHNPNPGYTTYLRCAQEAVYPLYTIVFVYYAFSLVAMLLLRPILVYRIVGPRGKRAIYLTMYALPALVVFHATCCGLVYYAFPYIIIIISLISISSHFAFRLDQRMSSLFLNTVKDGRNLAILFAHWFLHAYGIVAITELRNPVFHFALLALVPLPAAFYILTSKFTDPSKLHLD